MKKHKGNSAGLLSKIILRLGGLVLMALLAGVLTSCVTDDKVTLVVPPNIPGATFVGADVCAQCHDNIARDFKTATHSRLMRQRPQCHQNGM